MVAHRRGFNKMIAKIINYLKLKFKIGKICFCPMCGGDGKETCDNPDHGFINLNICKESGRLGCPVCGHDPGHKVPDGGNCYMCDGDGIVKYKEAKSFCEDVGKKVEFAV